MDEQVPTKVCVGVPDDVLRPHSARAELPITDFGYDKRQPDGYGRYCRKCMNTFSSKKYQERAVERKKEKEEDKKRKAMRQSGYCWKSKKKTSWTMSRSCRVLGRNNFEEVEKKKDD